ncbi:ribosomal protein L13 family protein [Striga asiatica]|uniref:Ribosomal protein L13 family protein n=1 Tax=Striga asiatica TaxID=4170 RepID=A0A5A7QS24_STRAF|nr:ribosomal protein L13 family protein [Striga asiatica]
MVSVKSWKGNDRDKGNGVNGEEIVQVRCEELIQNGGTESGFEDGIMIAVSCWKQNGRLGMGGRAFREDNDLQLWDASRDFHGSSVEAYIVATMWVLEEAKKKDWKNIICYVDCKEMVECTQDFITNQRRREEQAYAFNLLVTSFNSCTFSFNASICKDCNFLAKMAIQGDL